MRKKRSFVHSASRRRRRPGTPCSRSRSPCASQANPALAQLDQRGVGGSHRELRPQSPLALQVGLPGQGRSSNQAPLSPGGRMGGLRTLEDELGRVVVQGQGPELVGLVVAGVGEEGAGLGDEWRRLARAPLPHSARVQRDFGGAGRGFLGLPAETIPYLGRGQGMGVNPNERRVSNCRSIAESSSSPSPS